MRKHLKKYFIPHEGNDYKPHFLQEASVAVLSLIVVALFLTSFLHVGLILSDKDFLAAVLPGVLVDLTNEERQDNDLGTLVRNPLLDEAARLKAKHMAENSYFAHNSPDGLTPWHWFYQTGYQFQAAGENLAVNFTDSDEVVRAWMESPGHRANILNNGFNEVGMALAEGEYNGRKTIFVVQLFGTPASRVGAQPENTNVAGTQANSPDEEVSGSEITVESQGPVSDEDEGDDSIARADIEEFEVTDVVEQNDSLYIAVRDPKTSYTEDVQTSENAVGSTSDKDMSSEEGSATTSDEVGTTTEPVLATTGHDDVPRYSGFFGRLLAQPHTLLKSLYLLIGALVVVAIGLSIAIEYKKQHPLGVAYGVMLLALITGLTYLNKTLLFSELLIV